MLFLDEQMKQVLKCERTGEVFYFLQLLFFANISERMFRFFFDGCDLRRCDLE